jgi:hypothetical protein
MNVRLKKTLPFTAGVWHEQAMHMNNYVATVHLYTNCTDPISQNIAMERLKYFVYHELDSSILIDQTNKCCSQLSTAGLKITTMPEAPVDQLVGIMLFHKLNAVAEQRLVITEVEISSDIGENLVYLHDQDELTDDIVKPKWWTSADPLHSESTLIRSGKVVAINRTKTWRELDLAWPADTVSLPGNIVVFADFKRNDTE